MKLVTFSTFGALASGSSALINSGPSGPVTVYEIPGQTVNALTIPQFVSSEYGFDAPKVAPLNDSAIDWWYFDAVSFDLEAAVQISFLTPGSVGIVATFPNGTIINVETVNATSFTVVVDVQGASGEWAGTGISFTGAPDMSSFNITIDNPALDIYGVMTLKSIAPAHYPCAPVSANQTMEILPNLGWANAVPDAQAEVNLTINGSPFVFSGSGYHDKNWADASIPSIVQNWYWGHGRLGPYSIVWYQAIGQLGSFSVSSYVSLNNTIIASDCVGIEVRPIGQNDTFPPTATSGHPSGYNMTIDLGARGTLFAEASTVKTIVEYGANYVRYIGSFNGNLNGQILPEGVAVYEEMKYMS